MRRAFRIGLCCAASLGLVLTLACEGVDSEPAVWQCPSEEIVNRYAALGSPVICGGCDDDCMITTDTPDQWDLDNEPEIVPDGVEYDPVLGGIVIGSGGSARIGLYAWVANTWESTVTKVHLENWTVDGVYRVGYESQHFPLGGAWSTGNRPSRSAVDGLGNAYVASRGFNGQGSVTKIAADAADCKDVNGDGDNTDTSAGLGDIRGWPDDGDQDECTLWQVPVGGLGALPRALALDPRGRLWVGLYSEDSMVVLDSEDGSEVATVPLEIAPYGAACDSDGTLWITSYGDWAIQAVDTSADVPTIADTAPSIPTGVCPYGIAIDGAGRVFLGDWSVGGILRYTPSTDTWDSGDAGEGRVAGIAVDSSGRVYTSNASSDSVTVYDADSLGVLNTWYVDGDGGGSPRGVCPDFSGRVWAANFDTSNVSVIDPDTGVLATIDVQGRNYTYSDFTGYGLMTFVAPSASFYRDYDSITSCGALTALRTRVFYDAGFPEGGQVAFYGESADDPADFGTNEIHLATVTDPVGSVAIESAMDAALDTSTRQYFRLRVELLRGGSGPVMRELILEEYCN